MSLPSINFLHLTVSEIQPGQTISRRPDARPPDHPDTMGENNTPTAIKGCGVKMTPGIRLERTDLNSGNHVLVVTEWK